MEKFLKTKDYHVRKRLPDGRLGYRYRVIFEQAHGPIPPHMVIHHINGDENDDRLSNLELLTRHAHTLFHENFFINKKTKASIKLGRLVGPGKRVRK